ncbi:hypothetical protein BKA70DRAFT_1095724 [Coprinopsis sp. MPI-PUGE-AT-0042]|nr:hypothetical protein BKA70DRAFT_1095724 [Coprinopsis sp. MPI-PUGE-AT-0042]
MERRSTRSQITLDNDILKVPFQSPMKQGRRARTNTASSSRSRLAEVVTADTEDDGEDELLLSPNKRNGTPSDSTRKRSASPTPPNGLADGTPEEGRDSKRVKRDADSGKDGGEEPVQTRDAVTRVAGMHARNHSDFNLMTRKTSKRLASRLASEKPRSVVSDEPGSRQGSLPPADNGRAQSVPAFPTHLGPHLDLASLQQLPSRNRSRSRSPSKNSTPKNPLKPLPSLLTRLPSIPDEGASTMDVDEVPQKDVIREDEAVNKTASDAMGSVHEEEQNPLQLTVNTKPIEPTPQEPDPPAIEEEPLSPLTPTTEDLGPEEVVAVQVEVAEKSQPTGATQVRREFSQSALELTTIVSQTRTTRTSKASSSKAPLPPAPAPQIQKKKSQSRLPRPVASTSQAPAMAVATTYDAKNSKPTKSNGIKPAASTTNGNATKRNAFDLLMKRPEKASTSNVKDKTAMDKAKGVLGSVPSLLSKGKAKVTEGGMKTKLSSMKGKMKGKGAKAEPKPAPALVPIPSDEEDMLADNAPVNGKVSPPPVEEEPEIQQVETNGKGGESQQSPAIAPVSLEEESIYVEDEPMPEGPPNPPIEPEPQPLVEEVIEPEPESLPPPEVIHEKGALESQTDKAPQPADVDDCIVPVEEPNPFVVEEEQTIKIAVDATVDEPTRVPSPADSMDQDEHPAPGPLAKGKAKALGKKRAPSAVPTGGRVTRSSSTRDADTSTQTKPTTKASGHAKTKQTTLKFPKAGARSASTRRKSVGPSMAHEAPKPEASTSISSRTRRKSLGPAPQPEASTSISGRGRRKSLGAKSTDTHASAEETMPPIDLTADSPFRRSSRHILSISTPTLRTPASSPTKGTTRKTSVSPSKRAARSASPSPTKKVVRSYSMVGGRPDRDMADNRFVKTGSSSLSTLANALEALRMPAPSRPNTSLGFNDNGDSDEESPFAERIRTAQDDTAVGKKNAVAGSSKAGAGIGRANTLGANHLKNKVAGIGTSGRTGPFARRGGTAGRGKPLFGVGPVGRRVTQKASKNPSLPAVMGSPVKGGGDGDVSMSHEDEEILRNGFQDMLQKTANGDDSDMEIEVTATTVNKGKGKQRPGDFSRRASLASQFLSQSRTSLFSEPSTSGKGSMGPPPLPAAKPLARSASGSSAVAAGSTEEGTSEATPPGRRSTRTAAAAASQAIANVAASSRRGPVVEAAPAPDESLKFLKDCTIFVDVRTEDGDEAGALFIEMLEVAGARLLGRVGQSCTHVVYKNGLQSTINRYRQLRDPKPLVVGIAWVVECVEQRTQVDETEHIIDLEEVSLFTNPAKRRRSLLPRLMSRDASDFPTAGESHYRDTSNDGDVSMDGSVDDLTPLERARNRRQSALFPPPPQL